MINIFSSFTYGLFAFVAIAALLIIFEKQLIALEDKFDEWLKKRRNHVERG